MTTTTTITTTADIRTKAEILAMTLRIEIERLQAELMEASQGFIKAAESMHSELQRGELPGSMRLTPDALGEFYAKIAKLEAKRAALAALELAV